MKTLKGTRMTHDNNKGRIGISGIVIGGHPGKTVESIRNCLEQALTTDDSHHKQWYLWQIAETLGFHLDIDADKGIVP